MEIESVKPVPDAVRNFFFHTHKLYRERSVQKDADTRKSRKCAKGAAENILLTGVIVNLDFAGTSAGQNGSLRPFGEKIMLSGKAVSGTLAVRGGMKLGRMPSSGIIIPVKNVVRPRIKLAEIQM